MMNKKKVGIVSAVLIGGLIGVSMFLRSIYVAPVLMYHFIDKNDKESKLVVTPESFKRQMEFLKGNEYNVISLDELADIIRSGKPVGPKTVCITFDDGSEDNYLYAYPVLKELDLPATIFVYVNAVGTPGYLTVGEMRQMLSDSKVKIGSHTKAHYWLGKTEKGKGNPAKAREEVYGSKKALEEMTGSPVTFFSYPGGGFTSQTRQMVLDAGYKGAVATNPGAKYPNNDIYALKRSKITRTSNNLAVFWVESSGYYIGMKKRQDND
ncbi:MAG: polysaccharide deacetylase family protein [Candidatus Omnitrophica bacterium]|nr:polysaccharide deacetylase family protein [Candidatus Omnitrophota bacterium]